MRNKNFFRTFFAKFFINKTQNRRKVKYFFSIICGIISLIIAHKLYNEYNSLALDPVKIVSISTWFILIIFIWSVSLSGTEILQPVLVFMQRKNAKRNSVLARRIMSAFSLGVALPAMMVAVFSTYFFHVSIKSWFDQKISTVLEQSNLVAQSYVSENIMQLKDTAIAITNDLSAMYYNIAYSAETFNRVLNAQARIRSIDEALVFQKNTNSILAQTSMSFSLSFFTIPDYALSKAESGEIVYLSSDPTKIRILIKLQDFEDTYLLIGRLIDRKIIEHIEKTRSAESEYIKLKSHIDTMQVQFSIALILLSFIVILFTLYFSRNFAEKLIRPIRELVFATEKVRQGDLTTRVKEDSLPKDETRILSAAFNKMIHQLETQKKDLITAQRALAWSDVARQVAHEIKNPLTPIMLSADILLNNFEGEVKDKERFVKNVKNIQKHSKSISLIVSEFANFARMPSPVLKKIDMAIFLREIIDSRAMINSDVNYEFICDQEENESAFDPNQMLQVMSNLLKNAEESMREGKIQSKQIKVRLTFTDKNMEISVEDNGHGFSQELLIGGIKPYSTSKAYGSGLGLAIVERIIIDHFGRVFLSNIESNGARVLMIFDKKLLLESL